MKTSKSVRQPKICKAKRHGTCMLPVGHTGDHVARKSGGVGHRLELWSPIAERSPTAVGAHIQSWPRCTETRSAGRKSVRCDRDWHHAGNHRAIVIRDGKVYLDEWATKSNVVISATEIDEQLDVAERLRSQRELAIESVPKTESLTDLCDKCGRELGEHDGKKCPRKRLSKPTRMGEPSEFGIAIKQPQAGPGRIAGYLSHPAAEVYPLLEEDELEDLAGDIRLNGQREPIWLVLGEPDKNEPLILDGRNRARACELAGVEPRVEYYKGDTSHEALIDFVESKNDRRRHLDKSVRAMIAANVAKLRQGQKQTGRSAGLTQAGAAKKQGVSERLVRKATVVRDEGSPKLKEAVMRGRLAIEAAEVAAKGMSKKEQDELAKKALAKKGDSGIKVGHVRALVRQGEKRAVVQKINKQQVRPMPVGPFRLIVVDYPWPYDNSDGHDGSRGHAPYPTMPLKDIYRHARTEIQRVAHDDCILALWVTNHFVHVVGRVLEEAGFVHQSMLTWNKLKMGLGVTWPRGQTEHLVFATQGSPVHTLNEITTLYSELPREHSRKPDGLMDLLEKHCPGPHMEMFAQTQRPNWAAWGAELGKFEAA